MRTLLVFIIVIFVLLLGATIFLAHLPIATAPTTQLPPADCGGCVGIAQNGHTITVVPTDRITIQLPTVYDEHALTIVPVSSMGETFGASAPQGYWVRTFEAEVPGTTTITVPVLLPHHLPYVLTVLISTSTGQ